MTDVRATVAQYHRVRQQHEAREAAQAARLILETVPGPEDPRVGPLALEAKRFAEGQLNLSPVPLKWTASGQSFWGAFRATPPRILLSADLDASRVIRTVLHECAHAYAWRHQIPDDESQANQIAAILMDRWTRHGATQR